MEKVKINMVGGGFQHDNCSSGGGNLPKLVEWVKGNHYADISIHIDNGILQVPNPNKRNFAWIMESSAICGNIINWVAGNIPYMEQHYEAIFTHDRRLLSLSPKMKMVLPNAIPWVKDVGIHKKSKLVSIIASHKKMTPGHLYRHEILAKYKGKMDAFGTGHNWIEHKEEGLKDYYFSIAMENAVYETGFCEKITDCFAMGTIPIYWGTPDIGDLFNIDGIILLDENFNIDDLSVELYESKIEAVKDNYQRALELPTSEDDFYLKYIK